LQKHFRQINEPYNNFWVLRWEICRLIAILLQDFPEHKVDFVKDRVFKIEDMNLWENYVKNSLQLTYNNPILLVNWYNASWKTTFIKWILKHLEQALTYGYTDSKMTIWWIDNFVYIDRVYMENYLSAWEQDIKNWIDIISGIKTNDLVILNIDEIFTTMDKKYSTAFAYNFVWKLLEMWKFAVVVSHNHEFIEKFSKTNWVKTAKFESYIDKDWNVIHNYKLVDWTISHSHGIEVLKSSGIWNEFL
jgi:hypothetical protein